MSNKLAFQDAPDATSLRIMRSVGGRKLKWAAYRNEDGHLIFLAFGPGTVFKRPPLNMPVCDDIGFPGYTYVGVCNPVTAIINYEK